MKEPNNTLENRDLSPEHFQEIPTEYTKEKNMSRPEFW